MKGILPLPPFEDSTTMPQRVWGLIYLPLHILVLPLFLNMLQFFLPGGLDEVTANIIYYGLGFVFCLSLMWKFLRAAYDRLCDNKLLNIIAFISGFFSYYFLSIISSAILLAIVGDGYFNLNQESVKELAESSPNAMLGLAVFLAPVVEEVLFRGVLFGSIRRKNRLAAYIITILVFGIYHVWQSVLVTMDWRTLVYLLQYIVPGFVLCRMYERTSCIWIPIFMHMAINMIAMLLV